MFVSLWDKFNVRLVNELYPDCTRSHYTGTRPTSYVLWSPLHSAYHARRNHSHFKNLWYDWTQHQSGIEPVKLLGQCWVSPIVTFYDQQGLLRAYSSLGSH